MALKLQTLAKGVGYAAGKGAKTIDNLGYAAGKLVNEIDIASDVITKNAEILADATTDAYKQARGPARSYKQARTSSPKVKREIESGVRNADGTKAKPIKEASVSSDQEPTKEALYGKKYRKSQVMAKDKSKISYSQTKDADGNPIYQRTVEGRDPINLTREQYQMHLNGQDEELAEMLLENANAFSIGDVAAWAEENQGWAAAIAVGGSFVGGGLIFDALDDD